MGMNYYTRTEKCPTCGHKPEGIHLGKSSMGWQFSFQYNGGQYYKNVEEMREWLKEKRIEDEYGAEVSHEDFWKMVAEKQKPEFKNHAAEVTKSERNAYNGLEKNLPQSTRDMVINGYSFTDCNFS